MAEGIKPLTHAEKEEVFRLATSGLPRHFGDEIAQGMTDDALEEALKSVLGIFGGSCGPESLSVAYQGSGLKIWGGWHIVNHCTEQPIFHGKGTIAMARTVYGIVDPNDRQLGLF